MPYEVLKELAKDDEEIVCRSVARNLDTPSEVLRDLAKDEDDGVRMNVAENVNTPQEILIELARDEDWHVRRSAAENENTPQEVLRELAKDEYWRVRMRIVWNKNTPQEVLRELAKDKDWEVRMGVVRRSVAVAKKKEIQKLEKEHSETRNEEMIWGKDLEGAEDFAKDLAVAQETSLDIDGADIPNNTPQERGAGSERG